MAFEGDIGCCHINDNTVGNKRCIFLFYFLVKCALLCSLYVHNSSSVREQTYATWQPYLLRGIYVKCMHSGDSSHIVNSTEFI